jgi:hypothetical protein
VAFDSSICSYIFSFFLILLHELEQLQHGTDEQDFLQIAERTVALETIVEYEAKAFEHS